MDLEAKALALAEWASERYQGQARDDILTALRDAHAAGRAEGLEAAGMCEPESFGYAFAARIRALKEKHD